MKKITMKRFEIMLQDASLESKKSKHKTDRESALCNTFIDDLKHCIHANKIVDMSEIKGKVMVVALENTNVGTNKWVKMQRNLTQYESLKYSRETPCYYFFTNTRGKEVSFKKDNIICIVK